MSTDQDLEIVQRVLEGNDSAFEMLVRRWQKPLINLAFRFCRDRQRAEEMAQDAFMQIYRKLEQFRGDATFSTWLFAVSLNVFRSALRRRSISMDSIDDLQQSADESRTQLELERSERDRHVRRAVLALPRRYRDALIIFYFREMNLAETAGILGVSEGTAKSWLHRGRELLRRKLESREASIVLAQEVHL